MSPPLKAYFKRPYPPTTKHPSLYFKIPSCLDDAGLIRPQDALARWLPLLTKPLQDTAFQNKKSACVRLRTSALFPMERERND
jgi:hypothetical protein